MNEKLVLTSENTKITTKEIGRGRMKITIKCSKEEAEALTKFKSLVVDAIPELNDEQFYKHMFFKGITTFEKEFFEKMQEFKSQLDKQKADATAAEGIVNGVNMTQSPEVKS